MSERPSPDGADRGRKEARDLRTQRLRVVLLVMTVFGLPMVLMLSYLGMRSAAFRPPFGQQPGGVLTGSVLHADGKPAAGAEVTVMLHPRDLPPVEHATAAVDADGSFSVEVPPLDGCYVVVVGGQTWVRVAEEVSLVNDATPTLEYVLKPGSEIALTLTRRDGRPVRGGEYVLRREPSTFGLGLPSSAVADRFEADVVRRGGLRPGRWELVVELPDGLEAKFELELTPGRHELALAPI